MTVVTTQRASRLTGCQLSPPRADGDALFPLPLTPFELYMLLDDGPSHPMQFSCRLQCDGHFHVDHLDTAVRQALVRHPMLTAKVHSEGGKRFEWVAAQPPSVRWLPSDRDLDRDKSPLIDIRSQPGVRMACQPANGGSELTFLFHHAACDGLGAMDFIVDVLVGYANLEQGADHYGRKPLDRQRLHSRSRSGVTPWQWGLWCLRHLPLVRAAYRFYKRRPQPLFQHALDTTRPISEPSVRKHHFSPEESRQLRASAQRQNTTVNTLLLRDLLLAFHELRRERLQATSDDWLRVTIPLNMRGTADRQLPAANLVSLGFVDRPVAALEDPQALLRGVDQSLQQMVQQKWGLGFLTGLTVMREFPHTLAKHLRRNRCFSTVLLSNFGTALPGCCLPRTDGQIVAGNVVIRGVELTPLLRPLQLANFAVSHYAGRYVVTMRYDTRHLDSHDADDVLRCYVHKITASFAPSGSPGAPHA